jgi:hypothetical protein
MFMNFPNFESEVGNVSDKLQVFQDLTLKFLCDCNTSNLWDYPCIFFPQVVQ